MDIIKKLTVLFYDVYGKHPDSADQLPASGSARTYYKIQKNEIVVLGAYNQDIKENEAFFAFSRHFYDCGFPIPKIIAVHSDKDVYLIEYLGDTTLYDFLSKNRSDRLFFSETVAYYRKVIHWLPQFQIKGVKNMDFSVCYPRAAFDRQSMQWDLNYFKYYFVKLSCIGFNEQYLERDFETLTNFLLEVPMNYFMYRDFQSRNIMVQKENVYFIDYQGGRKGALQYDIASLLWDAKADIDYDLRKELLECYLDELTKIKSVDYEDFKKYYYAFVLIRILQALGTYGYRGCYERKTHFLQSIPYALQNLQWLFDNVQFQFDIPELENVLKTMIRSSRFKEISQQDFSCLTVAIHSFSFRRGIPYDPTGNGGGHIFDCRILPNPGKESQYQDLTGCDKEVKDFLDNNLETEILFENVKNIVIQSIVNYNKRNFKNLMVCFGCTGGQHRSVYFAERMAAFLQGYYPEVNIILHHDEQKQLNKSV